MSHYLASEVMKQRGNRLSAMMMMVICSLSSQSEEWMYAVCMFVGIVLGSGPASPLTGHN